MLMKHTLTHNRLAAMLWKSIQGKGVEHLCYLSGTARVTGVGELSKKSGFSTSEKGKRVSMVSKKCAEQSDPSFRGRRWRNL